MFAVFGIMITSEAGAVLRHSIGIHFPVQLYFWKRNN